MQRDTGAENLSDYAGFKDKAQISIAEVGSTTRYGYAERLVRAIKGEEVDLSSPLTFIRVR